MISIKIPFHHFFQTISKMSGLPIRTLLVMPPPTISSLSDATNLSVKDQYVIELQPIGMNYRKYQICNKIQIQEGIQKIRVFFILNIKIQNIQNIKSVTKKQFQKEI